MSKKRVRRAKPRTRWGLRVHLEDGGMRVQFPRGMVAELLVDGALQAEFGLGADGPEDLRRELREARAAKTACLLMDSVLADLIDQHKKPDHVVDSKSRSAAWAAGLEAGLRGDYAAIGADPQHSIKPSVVAPDHKLSGPSYSRGWALGSAIFAAVYMSKHGSDPRRDWGS